MNGTGKALLEHRAVNLLQEASRLFRFNADNNTVEMKKSSTPDPSRKNSGLEATSHWN
jgi:hypothetical protein